MKTQNPERWNVTTFLDKVPGSAHALRMHNIDANVRLTLANAAEAVSASTDEVFAVMERRMRMEARKAAKAAKKQPKVTQVRTIIQDIPIEIVESSRVGELVV